MEIISPDAGWTAGDIEAHVLDGDPPTGFDCGREMQNRFLYERAWEDQEAGVTVTHLTS